MENLSQMGIGQKQLTERYAEYSGPTHDQQLYYPYEPAPPSQGHVSSFKHQFVNGGHKNNAAMSALTLLAFLFFLHILQQCLKDHMVAMSTPQIMIMTGGREGEENIAKLSNSKIDKTGEIKTEQGHKINVINHNDAVEISNDDSEKYLMKITTSEKGSWKKHDTHEKFTKQNIFSKFDNQRSTSSLYSNAADN
ncbi:unnamed protein product [Euphydryas editha]|uniref:Uncharacterized protein n=1 Tax=Euphydryas editha TaxID=104508 RepID=A0AAU9U0M9_EUPED|nr:unnamed protein product [Euphydryas editha]